MWMIVDAPADVTPSYVETDSAGCACLRAEPFGSEEAPEGIVHFLPHGGEVVRRPVQRIDDRIVAQFAGAPGFLPEDSRGILRRAAGFLERYPSIPQILLCDTAFFASLPPEAGLYAVPYRFSGQGIRRYGGDGLIHEWVWRQVIGSWPGKASRLISLRLGNRSNIAAIRDGAPVDTSIGFTPAEGLPSDSASGDVDPTLVFELHSQGYALEEVYDLLCRQSGFSGYCGTPTTFLDMVRRRDAVTGEVRDIFFYSLARYLGATLAMLDGADALAISADAGWDALDAVVEVCRRLAFLGVRIQVPKAPHGDAPAVLSGADSSIMVIFFPTPRWKILCEQALTHRQGVKEWNVS